MNPYRALIEELARIPCQFSPDGKNVRVFRVERGR